MASVLLDRIDVDNTGCYVTERGDHMTAEDQAGSKQVTIINFTYTPGQHDTKSSNHIEEQQMGELPKQKQVGSKEEYTCLECGKIYRFSHQLKSHMRFHNKGSLHRCQVCGKFFLRNILLKYHMKKKHPQELLVTANIAMSKSGNRKVEKPSIIEDDGKTNYMEDRGMEEQCTEQISINHRGNAKCSGNEEGIKDKWCKYCQKESDASHVKQHDYIQNNKRAHKCDRCLKVFTKRSVLNRHKKSHLKNKGWSRSRSRSKQFGGHLEKQSKTKQIHALTEQPDEHDGYFEKDIIPEIVNVPKNNDNIKTSEPEKSKLMNKYGMRSRSRSCIEGQVAVDSEPRSQNSSDMLGLIEVENGDSTLKTYRCTRCSKDFKKCGNLINHVSMHLKEMMLKRRKKRVETSELGHSNQVTISISPMKNSVTINSESSMAQNKFGDIHAVYEKDSNSVVSVKGDNWMESVNSVGTDPSIRLKNSGNVSKFPQKNKTGTNFLIPKWSKMNPEKGFGKTNKNEQKQGKTTANEKSEVSLKAGCVKGKTSFLDRNYTSDNTRISESIKGKAGGFEGKGADRPNINLAGVKSQQSVTTKLYAKYSKQRQKRRHSALRTDKQDLKSDKNSDKNLTIKSRSTCHLCGHVFAQPWYLKTHIMTHTGEKPLTCDQCKRTFLHLNSLKRHKLFVHRK